MAEVSILAPFLLSWEGGFVNDPDDRGGATNKGVTLSTWRSVGYDIDGDGDIDVEDLKLISDKDAIYRVLKPYYWDKIGGDYLVDQGVANILADWAYMSGYKTAAKAAQRIVGATVDGVVGPRTVALLNSYYGVGVFEKIKAEREAFYQRIVKNRPQNAKFLKGWLRRLDSIQYSWLNCNGGERISWI